MATTEHFYTGNNSTTSFAFTFPYLSNSDVKVELDNVVKTENSSGQTNNDYTINNTNIVFNSAPGTGVAIHIYRTTNVDSAQALYAAGSSIRAADLNNNQTQLLYSAQEAGQLIRQSDLKDSVVNSAKIIDGSIATGDLADGLITTAKIAGDAVTQAKINNNAITTNKIVDGNVTTAKLANTSVTTDKLANTSVTTAKIADSNVTTAKIATSAVTTAKVANQSITEDKIANNAVGSSELKDNAVDTAAIQNNAVTTAKIADSQVTTAKIADDAITNAKLAPLSVGTNELGGGQVTTAKIANDAVTGSKIADNQINSEHYIDGSIDTVHIADSQVTTAKLADNSATNAKVANNAVTQAKIATGAVTSSKIADLAVETAKLGNNAVTTAKISNTQVTDAKLASNSVTTSKITDANVTTVKVADSNITLAKLASDLKQTTISDSDTQLPTSGAVVDYVAAQIAPLGGLEVIATEVAFPNTQPSSGVVISISDAAGVVVNGSGTSTTGRTVGGSTVTINNFPSSLNNETLASGVGLMVSSTGSSQTYNYHKILAAETDVKQLSDDINDFNARYRVGSSNPTSNNDSGDLFFNTGSGKLLVYNGTSSAWEEAQSIGQYFINTISSYSGTGGNSATFDGSAYRFVLSNPGATAEQHIVSINGVVQKPNSGTSQPSEGFAIDGSSIIFSSPPPSGSIFFIITIGSTVNIGTPSNGTVSTDKLTSGAVTTVKIADDAVTGDKIATNLDLPDNNKIRFGTGNDFAIHHDGSHTKCLNTTGNLFLGSNGSVDIGDGGYSEYAARFIKDGAVELYYDNARRFYTRSNGTTVQGNGTGAGIDFSTDTTHRGTVYFDNANKLHLYDSQGHDLVTGLKDGAVELYHNNNKKLETTSYGNLSAGQVRVSASNASTVAFSVGDAGTGFYNTGSNAIGYSANGTQKWNINSSGSLTLFDNVNINFGTSSDLQIYHDGSTNKSILKESGSGAFDIQGNWVQILNAAGTESKAIFKDDGAVELYHDNTKRFETTANGVEVSAGRLDVGSVSLSGGGLALADNDKVICGNGDDLQIYHSGDDSFIKDTGVGGLRIDSNQTVLRNSDGSEHIIETAENGAVKLFFNGANRLETQNQGVKIHVTGSEGCLITGATGTTETLHMQNTTNGGLCQFGMQTQDSDGLHHRAYIVAKRDGGNYSGSLHLITRGKTHADGGLVLSSHNNYARFQYNVLPYSNNNYTIGNSGSRWSTIYSNNSLNTSDKNLKNSIQDSDLGLSFINKLRPVSYKWNQKEEETADTKTHYGFIAQEVETAIKSESKTLDDFAGVFKPDNYKEDGSGDAMAIAIAEIVSPLVKAVQELSAKVTALEAK